MAVDETSTEDAVDSVEDDVDVTVASPTYLRSRLLALRAPIVATEEDEDELMTLVVLALTLLLLADEGSKLRATSSGGPERAVDAVTAAARSCAIRRLRR